MNKHFIKIRNQIFCLEEVSSACLEKYGDAPPSIELIMNNGNTIDFYADDAQMVWDLLCASALHIVE